jgi:SAM-dependent methyltransferase
MPAWHEDDAFWERFAPFMFTAERIELARADLDGALKLLGVAPGAKILDLCCGIGRHSLELARRGFVVTGVDRTRSYLERARQAAAAETLAVEFIESDMRAFVRLGAFDGAINLFTSFGYFDDPGEDLKVAHNLCESLRSGAGAIIDVLGKEVLARIFTERTWETLPNGWLLLQERKLRSGWDWIDSHHILIAPNDRREYSFGHRLYSGAELAALLRQAGFSEVTLHGSLTGTPYDNHAQRLIALARK